MSSARRAAWVSWALLAVSLGCAGHVRSPIPEGEDYIFPRWRPAELTPSERETFEKAWRELLDGKGPSAERRFLRLQRAKPALTCTAVGIAYSRMRSGRFEEAVAGFDRVLAAQAADFPALMGAGAASARLGRLEGALSYYQRARAVEPNDALAKRRVGEIKLQLTERWVSQARAAVEAGDTPAAVALYGRALDVAPEITGLRIELAELLERSGERAAAVATLDRDPSGDVQVQLRLGALLLLLGDHGRAAAAFSRALNRDPGNAEALRGAQEARRAQELAGMPEEYRRIPDALRVTRADLAALLATKVKALQRLPAGPVEVAVDISGSWARMHIVRLVALGVMELYPNHTFQPGAIVRRADVAAAVGRALDVLGLPSGPAVPVSDVARGNLQYEAVSRVVAAGLMDLTASGAFEPWRVVSGREAVEVVEALARRTSP
jgi:tetratricopeptide (TPR) repeat protein